MMSKIDTTQWKEFVIGELFDIHPTKAYKLTNSRLYDEDGNNPVVVNSSFNNGVGGHSHLNNTEKGNIITFSDTTSADAIFYQKNAFIGYPHVQGMYPIGDYKNKWNEKSYLFFISVFRSRAIGLNFDYVNKFTREDAKKMTIKLPVDNNGDPNFAYMEQYMKNLESEVGSSLTALRLARNSKTCERLDVSSWKDFIITDFFELVTVKNKLSKLDLIDGGDIPVHSSETLNNGIIGFTKKNAEFYVKKNQFYLLFGDHTKSINIAEHNFSVMDNVKVLKPKIYNKKIIMYIVTVWKKAIPDLGYSRHWGVAKNIKFKLPIDINGDINFNLMEKYMQNLENIISSTLHAILLA